MLQCPGHSGFACRAKGAHPFGRLRVPIKLAQGRLVRGELPTDFYKLRNLKPVSGDEREGEIRGFQHLQISSFHHFKKEFLSLTILKVNDLLIIIKESSKQRDPGIQGFNGLLV